MTLSTQNLMFTSDVSFVVLKDTVVRFFVTHKCIVVVNSNDKSQYLNTNNYAYWDEMLNDLIENIKSKVLESYPDLKEYGLCTHFEDF